jgi:uncharacterized RDD family membrane protein YckC
MTEPADPTAHPSPTDPVAGGPPLRPPVPGSTTGGPRYAGRLVAGQPYPGQPYAAGPYAAGPYAAPPPGAMPPPGYAGPPTAGYHAPPPGMYPPAPGYPPPGYPMVPRPAMAPNGQPLAGFGDRFVARLLDGLILGAVALVLLIPLFIVVFTQASSLQVDDQGTPPAFGSFVLTILAIEAAALVLILAATYVYEVEMMYRGGQTVGKRVMKIKIIPLQPGAPLTRGAATRRWLVGQVAASFVPFFNWLDGLWQLWDKPFQQCLHDKAAGTVVVKLPS